MSSQNKYDGGSVNFEEMFEDEAFFKAVCDAEDRFEFFRELAAARKLAGISQKEVAKVMGTTQSAISDLEKGRGDAHLSTLQRFARAVGKKLIICLNQTPDYIVDSKEDDKEPPVKRLGESRQRSKLLKSELDRKVDLDGWISMYVETESSPSGVRG